MTADRPPLEPISLSICPAVSYLIDKRTTDRLNPKLRDALWTIVKIRAATHAVLRYITEHPLSMDMRLTQYEIRAAERIIEELDADEATFIALGADPQFVHERHTYVSEHHLCAIETMEPVNLFVGLLVTEAESIVLGTPSAWEVACTLPHNSAIKERARTLARGLGAHEMHAYVSARVKSMEYERHKDRMLARYCEDASAWAATHVMTVKAYAAQVIRKSVPTVEPVYCW